MYKIGVGLLLPLDIENQIRSLELSIFNTSKVPDGLFQPPHVTIKRPFEISSQSRLQQFTDEIDNLAKDSIKCEFKYTRSGSFPDGSVYIQVRENSELLAIHNKLLGIASNFDARADNFEGINVLFHTTIAINLGDTQKADAIKMADRASFTETTIEAAHIGLFLRVAGAGWVIIHRSPLSSLA